MDTTPADRMLKALHIRNKAYEEATRAVMAELGDFRSAVNTYIGVSTEDLNNTDGKLVWDQVEFLQDAGILLSIFSIRYNIGSTLISDTGDVMVVTEDNADYYSKTIRIGIPVDELFKGPSTIIKYLKRIDSEHGGDENNELITTYEEEFDTSGLTEEQQQSLQMVERMMDGNEQHN